MSLIVTNNTVIIKKSNFYIYACLQYFKKLWAKILIGKLVTLFFFYFHLSKSVHNYPPNTTKSPKAVGITNRNPLNCLSGNEELGYLCDFTLLYNYSTVILIPSKL